MSDELEPYENTLSIEELRREVRDCWDKELALKHALSELPEVPEPAALRALAHLNVHDPERRYWEAGTALQQRHRGAVPYKYEYEAAAGLWVYLRLGLLEAAPA